MASRMLLIGVVLLGVLGLAGVARANKAAPPPPAPEFKLVVEIDPRAEVSRLVLPADFEPPADPKPAPNKGAFWSPTRTMLAGLCLSLAVVSLLFVRTTTGGAKLLLIAVVGVASLGLGVAAMANAPPGPGVPSNVPPGFPPGVPAGVKLVEGPVQVEFTGAKGGPITLIVAKKALAAAPVAPPPAKPAANKP